MIGGFTQRRKGAKNAKKRENPFRFAPMNRITIIGVGVSKRGQPESLSEIEPR